jgi:organic radical activating enzyme
MDRYFPIKTATSCQLKWTWSTVRLYDGSTSSCHRVDPDFITESTFSSFHNTPKKLADRKLMLDGQWPSGGCEYCQKIEDSGGSSDRMFHTSIPNLVPPELSDDPNSIIVTPRIVEVYFDNVCNMSCLYCWDGFSSKIQQENIKFGRFEKQGVIIDNHARRVPNQRALTQKFWEWFFDHHKQVRRLHVLGGEPFFQPQFDECLEFLDQNPCPDLEFNVVSNLKISETKLKKILGQIKQLLDDKKIKRFDLTASIDCFGPQQEYVRWGVDVEQWKKNFDTVVNCDWIYLNFNQTLSGLTIKTIPELLDFVNEKRALREIGHYFSTTVMTHEFLHPGIFGKGFFEKDFDIIISKMPEDTWQQKEAKKYMQGICQQLDSYDRDQTKINRLSIFLTEMDRRRGTDWKITFPWLIKEVQDVV